MSIESRFAPRLVGLATAATLLLGSNACSNLDPVDRADIVVQPLEVTGAEFANTQLNADQLEAAVRDGVNYYNHATDNHLGKVSVAAAKPAKVQIEGINSATDLCRADRVPMLNFVNGVDTITHHKTNQRVIFLVNVSEGEARCLPGGNETRSNNRIVIFRDKSLKEKSIVAHELGHTEGLEHVNAWDCPKQANLTTDCTSVPYGDGTKLMGNEYLGSESQVPLTAFQLRKLGKISDQQIVKMDATQPNAQTQTVELSLPTIKDNKAKAISVHVGGVGNAQSAPGLGFGHRARHGNLRSERDLYKLPGY